jgi:hypothetical protein
LGWDPSGVCSVISGGAALLDAGEGYGMLSFFFE